MQKNIPLVDLKAQYKKIKKSIDKAIKSVISDSAFIGNKNNKYIIDFEKKFSSYIGSKYCVSCGNGTDAIEIALKALGIGQGDEVIVPALSWISTSEAVSNVGATPIFVDIDHEYYTIDSSKIEQAITNKTKAIIPVHIYGLAAEMDTIVKIGKKFKLFIIEDCAQAHGAEYKGKKVGTFGDAATFSFFPGKNLGAYGDAGCILTDNEDIEKKSRLIGNHGQLKKNEHLQEGRNSRMDGIQAAILSVKLDFLDKWISARRNAAGIYDKIIATDQITIPKVPPYSNHAYHLYVIKVKNRDVAREKLAKIGIETGIHYPIALPFLEPYKKLGYTRNDFPIAFDFSSKTLSLPIYPEIKKKELLFIADALKKIVQ